MSIITKSHLESFIEMTFDEAYAEAEKLENVVRHDNEGVTLFAGTHPVHGNIHIIIPPIGCGILMFPFVVRDFSCDKQ